MDEYLNNNIATNGSYFLLRMQQQSDEHNWLLLIVDHYTTTNVEEHVSALEQICWIITHVIVKYVDLGKQLAVNYWWVHNNNIVREKNEWLGWLCNKSWNNVSCRWECNNNIALCCNERNAMSCLYLLDIYCINNRRLRLSSVNIV